ncbi:acyltransferase family protein [Mesorhizobium sp.]|uniref:acyltransferase family protein n=1 Tax=Mesorhizobium sp. TaxID=1871066 RepID=UPI000FE38B97|nr:acyltransferase family protein [Mesorhizobium sp.]RWN55624.1 MAG: acyltransferase [Mesorhizobium sp.]RWN77225.1 MAG: acyltransferase [Mesorhizobium sp.]RWN80236.1 MAG: acyltransferase [Mesorhizobium sp.]RWN86149.1 MAG: acyltransferase [Mesorhizobium sp.]RWO14961.1 MAG: acyltransferase [Mesorhizobium sp.]
MNRDDGFLEHVQVLRGLSIVVVYLFHLDIPWMQSGYLGVDIFLVISGFLMAHLYGGIKGTPSVSKFYAKRFWRVIPAYMVVLISTVAIAGLMFSTPGELAEMTEDALWSAAMMPNIGFWTDASYFAVNAYRPFLHFWSLGVEMQYYAVFPLIAFLGQRRHWFLLIALGALTLAMYTFVNGVSAKTSFFIMPFRLWEFLAGYAAAMILRKMPSSRYSWYIGAPCALAILAIATFPKPESVVTWQAILVVVCSALAISSGLPKIVTASRPGKILQIMGRYSYSIYLVHLPVIVLYSYEPFLGTSARFSAPFDYAVVTIVTLVLSWLLYHGVEQPFRRPAPFARLGIIVGATAALVLVLSTTIQHWKRIWMDKAGYAIAEGARDKPAQNRCFSAHRFLNPLDRFCELLPPGWSGRTVLLIGNSHAQMIANEVVDEAARYGRGVSTTVAHAPIGSGITPSSALSEAVRRDADLILLHSRWTEIEPEAVAELVLMAASRQIQVAMLDPVPDPAMHVPRALWDSLESGVVRLRSSGSVVKYMQQNGDRLDRIDALTAGLRNFRRYPVVSDFCTPDCELIDSDGRPLYFDNNHVSGAGAKRLRPAIHLAFGDTYGSNVQSSFHSELDVNKE